MSRDPSSAIDAIDDEDLLNKELVEWNSVGVPAKTPLSMTAMNEWPHL
jgi:hypothetical protein